MTVYAPISSDGHRARWVAWDGAHDEELTLTWENEGWTASGIVSRERVQYVIRLSPTWQTRQFILFRDLEEPDLWLATDGHGHWGEMNGAHRPELDGCTDLALDITPFTRSLPIKRLPLHEGHTAEIAAVLVDVDTLEVRAEPQRYTRMTSHHWALHDTEGGTEEFDVDQHGLVLDLPGRYRRSL